MFSDEDIGRRGRHVLQLGLILAGLIGGVLWFWSPGIMRTIAGLPATTFTGTADQARSVLLALGILMLTGMAFGFSGLLMITGRSSRAATAVAVCLFLIGLISLGTALIDTYRK